MISAENWCIKVDEKIYGPYSTPQMRKFAHEGRLARFSLISPAGSRAWREAKDENTFASFFGYKPTENANAKRRFGRRDLETSTNVKPGGKTVTEVRRANFVIVFDVVNAAASRVEAAVMGMGPAFRIADNVWSVNCDLTAVGVRNAIAPYLLKSESIFVVDATRGKTSWQNYAPGTHSKISAAYTAVSKKVTAA